MSTSKFVPFKEANPYIGDAHTLIQNLLMTAISSSEICLIRGG